MKSSEPVLMENFFKEAAAAKGCFRILCVESGTKHQNNINGSWKFFIREGDPGEEIDFFLIKARTGHHRVVTTARGVSSLAMALGATMVQIPLLEGESGECVVASPPD